MVQNFDILSGYQVPLANLLANNVLLTTAVKAKSRASWDIGVLLTQLHVLLL